MRHGAMVGVPAAVSVAQAVDLINDRLFAINGASFVVEGEVSDYAVSQGKWIRFDLKDPDGTAILKCFLTTFQLTTPVKSGDHVIVHATPKVYPKYGTLSLNVNRITLAGAGAHAAALAALRVQLEREGLFDNARKRPIPTIPERIGLITSKEAAAYGDVLRILSQRFADVEVVHAHVRVQGDQAVQDIVEAIELFNTLPESARPDVLVLTRGGGGLEDLMAFNAEAVVRAVFGSRIPMVVAIGHERDTCLAELAADVRASTPSNAAERVVPDRVALHRHLQVTMERCLVRWQEAQRSCQRDVDDRVSRLSRCLFEQRVRVDRLVSTLQRIGERALLDFSAYRLQVDGTVQDMSRVYQTVSKERQARIDGLLRLLHGVSPRTVLQRGYALIRHKGRLVRRTADLDTGDRLEVELSDGIIHADVR